MNLEQLRRYAKTRNQRKNARKSRRASKRSRRRRSMRGSSLRKLRGGGEGGLWAYHIPDEAVVGRTSDEGVEGFKTMMEVREERDGM